VKPFRGSTSCSRVVLRQVFGKKECSPYSTSFRTHAYTRAQHRASLLHAHIDMEHVEHMEQGLFSIQWSVLCLLKP